MSRHHDDTTRADEPGCVTLSLTKLKRLHPELFGTWAGLRNVFRRGSIETSVEIIAEHMGFGDARAAVVVGIAPLLVAAYSYELDCAAVLAFDDSFARDYRLELGSRLFTVNTYRRGTLAVDLVQGPASRGRWKNVHPCIAEFLSDDIEYIEVRKREIAEAEWTRARVCGQEWVARGARPRDGRPLKSFLPR